ncbi:MAG: Gfo/Idh/MocA family protein [Agrococcus casei]|uniref:Gfo/Idh/MocA family protein n=1 Tax=Agrococcus casei TaxID=343512 RepID=UPI003F9C5AAB
MTERLRWAIVGASWIAGDRVIPALKATGQEVVALVTSSGEHGAAYAAEHDIAEVFTTLDVIDAGRIDAVYIGNLNEQHRPFAEKAAAKGWHVLVEKPMADSLEDAEAIVMACSAAGVTLAVNHHLVASGAVQKVRELIDGGAVGELRAVRVSHAKLLPEFLRTWRIGDDAGAGVIPDLTPHDASVVNALIGWRQLTRVNASGVRQSGWPGSSVDAMAATLVFDDSLLVTLHDAFTTPFAQTGVEVLGEHGAIWAQDLMDPDPIARIRLTTADGEVEVPYEARDVYEATVEAFVGAATGEATAFVDGTDGLAAARIAFSVEQAVTE